MAEIVLGLGTSHTPMLFTQPEDWTRYEARDRAAALLDAAGEPCTFDELVGRGPKDVTLDLSTDAYETCQRQLDRLADALRDAEPDAIIVIGDDQKELFLDENLPALLIYRGEAVESHHRLPRPGEPSWWSDALAQYYGDGRGGNASFPVASELACHLIEHLVHHEFDVAQSTSLPRGRGEGHAFAFVHARLLRYRHIPVVPLFLNTYYPPNQPVPARCLRLGAALRDAVDDWPEPLRVAVVASGGLSHFVIDEALDRGVLEALREGDSAALASLPLEKLNSGTSEIRNWIAMYGATDHLRHAWSEYVPCYRTAAGTGTGCAFGVWR